MNSKLFATLSLAALTLATVAAPAHASSIALQFIDGAGPYYAPTVPNNPANVSLTSTDVAGAPGVATAGWQTSPDLGTYGSYIYQANTVGGLPTQNLLDTTGAATTATLQVNPTGSGLNGVPILSGPANWHYATTNDGLSPSQLLYNSSINTGGGRTTELALSNIPYAQYSLYVYISYSTYQNGSLQLFKNSDATQGTAPLYFDNGQPWYPGDSLPTTYAQITSTDSANPTATGANGAYVEYDGLTDPNASLDFIGGGGISGIEIVDTTPAPVPEPASLATLAAASTALLLRRRKHA